MILTGKAKIDYHNWLDQNKRALRKSYLDDTCEHALIIEWLDSVGIFINIVSLGLQKRFYYKIIRLDITEGFFLHSERQEATRQAIIKANEIYNSLK